ncbi:hypothetical protein [Yunchengibacter salinarum]|uniref:hypothetical protein n=1 Tax=Yunchengibacter salinarum TaxID=3133399 RepID=UPI0035B67D5B
MLKILIRTALASLAISLLGVAALATIGTLPGGGEITVNGLIAGGLMVFFTLLVGFGLMALLFYSNRHGHDDAASGERMNHTPEHERPETPDSPPDRVDHVENTPQNGREKP